MPKLQRPQKSMVRGNAFNLSRGEGDSPLQSYPHNSGPIQWARGDVGPSAAARSRTMLSWRVWCGYAYTLVLFPTHPPTLLCFIPPLLSFLPRTLSLVEDGGGSCAASVTLKVTHIITTKAAVEAEKRSAVIATAIGRGLPLLHENFLGRCVDVVVYFFCLYWCCLMLKRVL